MRRAGKVALWVVGVVILLPLVLLGLVVAAANLSSGQRLIERLTASLTNRQVTIAGLHGRFPDRLRADHIALADAHGTWAAIDGVSLDWSPSALLRLRARIDTASIEHIALARRPVPIAPAKPQAPSANFSLPVAVDIGSLRVARADIAAPVAGAGFAASLEASASVTSLQAGTATLTVTRLDAAGSYQASGTLNEHAIAAHVTAREPARGLISALADLPALGAIDFSATIDGPKSAEQTHLEVSAGPLRAKATGTVDLPGRRLAADIVATAPAMRPRAGLSWDSIDLHGHVAGPFTTPDAAVHFAIAHLNAGAARVETIEADLTGNRGAARLHGALTGVHIPGAHPDLLAAAPVTIDADTDLAAPDRPLHAKLGHPLLTAELSARTAGTLTAQLHAVLPNLAPLAALGGTDVRGSADLSANLAEQATARHMTLTGTANITGGRAPVPGLLGLARIDADATLDGGNVTLTRAALDGRALHVDAAGSVAADAVALTWHASFPDLSVLSPQAVGAVTLAGGLNGPTNRLSVTTEVKGVAGSPQFTRGPVSLVVSADNLPSAPNGKLRGTFRLRDADVALDAIASTAADGAIHIVVGHADWKSVTTRADVTLPKSAQPIGKLDVGAARLADIAPLIGQPLAGSLKATLNAAATEANAQLQGTDLALGTRRIASLVLNARAVGAPSDPDLNATLTLGGIEADNVAGSAVITAKGRQNALQLRATADAPGVQGAAARLDTAALLNTRAHQIVFQTLSAGWKTFSVRLQSPARVDYGQQIAVDQLHLALGHATLQASGRLSPTLDFSASLHNFTPDIMQPLAPQFAASGTLSAEARLTGQPATPGGRLHVTATGLRMKTGPAASLPAASIAANATLNGLDARIDARIDAGPKLHFSATGAAPLQPDGAIALLLRGGLDLALLNPVLQANGRNARGRANLDLTVSGTAKTPRITGRIGLADAELQDYVQGVDLKKVAATIDANGDTFTITHFSAAAGPGTIGITGTVAAAAPYAVDLHVAARNARPLASDLLTALFDADLTVRGQAAGNMAARGKILLHRVDINIPEGLPPTVAQLNVRRAGQAPPPPPTTAPPPAEVHLAIEVDAPSNIFVRGKGLYAELGGTLHVTGTSSAPVIEGGFDMRRGDFSLAGTTLVFSRGRVGFNGAGVTERIDPTLDFQADSTQAGITATLKITGYADAPKIALSSVPDLPQDEIMARLLFGVSIKQLTPFQIAEIGAALAELSGVVGGEGPLGAIRKQLGLDRLSVGGASTGGGASVEAGRYVAKGVYVGTKQSTGGAGGTQVQVQIDLTRHLKLNSALGAGGGTAQGATPENDPGSSVGLSYQFEY